MAFRGDFPAGFHGSSATYIVEAMVDGQKRTYRIVTSSPSRAAEVAKRNHPNATITHVEQSAGSKLRKR